MRSSEEELREWTNQAKRVNRTVSSWIRHVLAREIQAYAARSDLAKRTSNELMSVGELLALHPVGERSLSDDDEFGITKRYTKKSGDTV